MSYLNVYRKYPKGYSSSTKLEIVCTNRIKLYKIFEAAKYNRLEVGTVQWSNYVTSKIQEVELKCYYPLLGLEIKGMLKAKREDNLAHWMVGLTYSATTEQRNLFIDWELQWVHLLFSKLSRTRRDTFLRDNNFHIDSLTPVEKLVLQHRIMKCIEVDIIDYSDTTFYKSEFYEVPDVVSKKHILLMQGSAIFHEDNVVYFVLNKLRYEFSDRLKFQKKVYPHWDKYLHIIQDLPKYIPKLIGCEVDGVNLENIDQISQEHFPLCMQHLHRSLRKNHHLKYDAKMQYGVFLYWLGLSYTDAMKFWKDEFTQGMSEDVFNRKYSYLFKHQYGMIGRRQPYQPFNCSKILAYSPLPLQHHGCPFKHWSKAVLRETLATEVSSITDIEDLLDEKDYRKACTAYLCKSRKIPKQILDPEVAAIESPIEYVNQSFKALDLLDQVFDGYI
ncbi:DNA primase large subunit-like [Diabrotica virgifera virgifera]|uniref:DNA primase large subunit C-terminal domain-containing protein n=1 Tax=Diabrotica virgifera virgifera TaxID=50390 RepID=A0ABM5IAK8_DIAVI|nr:DNA primase large subunit-like [Diabrotica virgifera virgifera]